jgi:hypothetical protein
MREEESRDFVNSVTDGMPVDPDADQPATTLAPAEPFTELERPRSGSEWESSSQKESQGDTVSRWSPIRSVAFLHCTVQGAQANQTVVLKVRPNNTPTRTAP